MTLSWPSALAAATRPFSPPNAAALVAVDALALLMVPVVLADAVPAHPVSAIATVATTARPAI
jgi:hypothetical protein